MLRFVPALFVLTMCRPASDPTSETQNAYVVRGRVTFKNTNASLSETQFGGPVHVVLFNTDAEGYCLTGPAAFAGLKFNAIPQGDLALLQGEGMAYEFSVPEAPGQTYPITIYPSAVWQHTEKITHACEVDPGGAPPKWNAGGFYGVDYSAGFNSKCCSYHSQPIQVEKAGQIIEDVNMVMVPQIPTRGSCYQVSDPYDACELRHAPPPNEAMDSACWIALGSEATKLITRASNAGPCP